MKKNSLLILLLLPICISAQYLPLSAGAGNPVSGTMYHTGNGYIRRSITPTYFGYSSSYRVLMLGSASNSYPTQEEGAVTISFGYDPSGNPNGAFTGHGGELLFRNGASFTTPNAENNSFHLNHLVLKDGRVGIGIANPETVLHLHKDAGSSPQLLIDKQNTYGIRIGVSSDNIGFVGSYNNTPVEVLVAGISRMHFDVNGNIGIGTSSLSERLSVNGNIKAKKVIVSQTNWPDYVFDTSYILKPLTEVKRFIQVNKHLPEVPSSKEVNKQGINLGDQQALLLKKVEELTLYLIKQDE